MLWFYLFQLFMEGDLQMLRDRIQNFLTELEIPVTVFCRKIQVTPDSFYKWRKGQLNFSAKTLQRISDYLSKYGF